MNDPEKTADTVAPNNDSDTCDAQIRPFPQEVSSASAGLRDLPDLTDFVNQKTEDNLNELFANRYTMANKLYVEVASGFSNPVIVYPWSKRPKRNFDYISGEQKSYRGGNRRNVCSEWSRWGNPSCDPSAAQESRKRRKPTMDYVRVSYPGRTNP
ncbi:hypothetical protein LOAG_01534 [Loa loa]|uniref:DDE_Tnp_1_7 domain-containing protein n=1 Tax=Loa loa TaxID=7209 RepID=A0A1I7VQ89_LOALO|nr:hypothetical protein LOAG_01534 [Loa loa]EFO26945.1 hypothetical protein LOAG_01534 [Loa loa]